ncbi:Uu.00g133170.m01.CDS01 [Anthostomella pinea]|uniref:Uu.00g133170.m01.CDS01 n=1 Tax=Anthostomella pinea TaxID=933095 RepID=A0AAI8VSZ7_9PEZI|nr:Uu.00g133170.m01.CDS01 [Anthostomella pinea]
MLSPEVAAQDKGPSVVATTSAVIALSTVFVIARLYVRARMVGKLQVDDYIIGFAVTKSSLVQIRGWLTVGFATASVRSSNGKHAQLLDQDQLSGAIPVLLTMVGFFPGVRSFAFPKLAAVYLLTKLMNTSKTHRIFLWTLSSLCVLILSGCIILLFAQCTPSRAQWDLSITEKTCWSPYVLVDYSIAAGAFSALVDLYLAVYPAIVLFRLQMNIKKKVALSISLGLGSVASIIALYKCSRIPGLASKDFTYDTADLTIWTCIEGSAIIIAACIPVLKPLGERILGSRAFGSSKDRYGYKNYGNSRSGNPKSDIELGSKQRPARYPHDLDTFGDRKDGSQESILPLKAPKTTGDQSHGIVRTQSVTITVRRPQGQPLFLSRTLADGFLQYGEDAVPVAQEPWK